MIQVSNELRALMTSGQYQRADLYTLTLVNGTVLRLTSWQVALSSGGNLFLPTRIGGDRKWKVALGLETDTFSVTIGVDPDNEAQINGVPFRQAARAGFLSGAQLEMDWAYLDNGALVGVLPRFFGTVGQVMPDRLGAQLTVNSPLKLLDMQVPTKLYGPRCRWTLGDANCGVNLASFAVSGTVGAGATQAAIPCSLTNPVNYFQSGTVTFTSGKNQGLKRQVRSSISGQLVLATPLPFAPLNGDTLSATPGCDHLVPSLAVTATIPAARTVQGSIVSYSGRQPIYGPSTTIPPQITAAAGAKGYADLGVLYASGPRAGQALTKVTGAIGQGQYSVSGNVYTFSGLDHGVEVTINFQTTATSSTATCKTVFNNAARNGATPFIPQPEVAY